MKVLSALFFAATVTVAAQTPQVPHKMQFADITLTIRDDARKEIQKDVDAYTKYPKHFNIKAERAKTYFPIIEKIFAEENVPDDFKYLAIQESALIADAVSSSNAVGFWQFKDFTAIEMGLRIDKEIDERLNIVSASRAAARYIKKNNTYFNNWLYALQAYQMGAGGVLRSEKESKSGKKNIEITSGTYWYVKKYLAHKIAYEDAVKGIGQIQVLTYQNQHKKSLASLAKEVAADENELIAYNKWTKSGIIPDDRTYTVLIPIAGNSKGITMPDVAVAGAAQTSAAKSNTAILKDRIKINGISAIKAMEGESAAKLAGRAGVELSDFLKWNDISANDRIEPGQYYLLSKKRTRASEAYHKVAAGENLWSISQQHGVRIKKLKRYNRIDSDAELKPGMTLWLSSMKPKGSDKAVETDKTIEVNNETFAWEENVPEVQVTVTKPVTVSQSQPEAVKKDTVKVNVPEPLDSLKNLQTITAQLQDSLKQQTVKIVVPVEKSEHIVQAGETLYGIARQYTVGVMDLVHWNGLDLQQGIKPGQILKLSGSEPIAKDTTITARNEPQIEHEVRPTDTVYSIARKYGVTIKELMEWNNKKDFTLSIGEKLKIPHK